LHKLLEKNKVVQPLNEHIHVLKGDKPMIEGKKIKLGNTTIEIYSPLAFMTSEERQAWYKDEWEKGNPKLQRIVECARDCLIEES